MRQVLNSNSCAIIVCDHGLGHIRRCALMAKTREIQGESVTLFAPFASIEKLQKVIPYINGLKINNFEMLTSIKKFKTGLREATEWLDRLPSLDKYQTVVCDNQPEILTRRPDAILSAQFFWHDVTIGVSKEYSEYCEDLLTKYTPKVIGCRMFSMDAVRNLPGFKSVGLYKNPNLIDAMKANRSEGCSDLLITGGSTPILRQKLKKIIRPFLTKPSKLYKYIHVDAELLPPSKPEWIVQADFSIDMYCRLKSAICRPGLGTLTDLLTVGVVPWVVHEKDNLEMCHNARIISHIKSNKNLINIL